MFGRPPVWGFQPLLVFRVGSRAWGPWGSLRGSWTSTERRFFSQHDGSFSTQAQQDGGGRRTSPVIAQTRHHNTALMFSPKLPNLTGSYQADATQNLTNLCRLPPEVDFETQINPKGTWCEKTKLNNIVHGFPERSTVTQKEDVKSPTSGEPNVEAKVVKSGGVPLTKGLPVPTAFINVHTGITATLQTQDRSSTFNSNLSDISEQSTVSRFTPECNKQKKPQIRSCLPPRPPAPAQGKVNKDQPNLVGGGANPNRKACAYVPECCTVQGRTADMPMTEEERAAKRRENWRIKKREQRAKRAEKLKKDKERTQCFENGQQKTGKLSCALPTRSVSSVNTVISRETKQPNSVKPPGLVIPNRQSIPQSFPHRNERAETAEERRAKQREYWRIKKRLQRARLSLEVKARLKERDALKRCAVRFQSNLEQMRRTQAGFQRPHKNMLGNTSETTGGFIRNDGTMAEIRRPATTFGLRAVKSTYLPSPSTSQSQSMVCLRARSAVRGIPYRMNPSVHIQQSSTDLNILTVDSQVRSKVASCKADADVLTCLTEASKSEEPNQENKTACTKKLRSSDSPLDVTTSLDLVTCDTIKQELSYPSIESVYSLAEQSHITVNKDLKPLPSCSPETKVEKEASSVCDSQATTLLVVASMKKLLEESLNSVVDTNTSSSGQDTLLPCKAEQEHSSQGTDTGMKPDLASHPGAPECNLSGYTNLSIEVKQSQSQSLCRSPPQTPGFSAEDTLLPCQDSSLQLPHTITPESSCFSQGPENTIDMSEAAGVTPLHRSPLGHSGRIAGSHPRCPVQPGGGQQLNERSDLQKKREYWRIMKRRQRARKAREDKNKYTMHHRQLSQIRRPFMTNMRNKSHFKAPANQELDPEEILRRKRMHWRIKKQEQRARKAARERELRQNTKLTHLALDSSNKITEPVQSAPLERLDYLPEQCQATSFKDEPELCFVPGDDYSDEPLSEARWRGTYLMDYDPINQLLVCMVCGEQQYCLSVEGVKAHIEEAHPGTLCLEEMERQGILQAWDEQVAVRERFFTNQLWQQSDSVKGNENDQATEG
ncbi:hypothetical protein NFI96_000481 [Prochilodus magdalenae]|nr:hypothetical protein NFI96_000481 [Prochilodus magdalenae]